MKILLLDIETAPNLAYVWGLWKENIPIDRIVNSGYVLCWAAKWLGEDEVHFDSIHKSTPKRMLERIHKLLNEADAVIHYNGQSFDIPTLNKEFVTHGLQPPAPYKQIDLMLAVKKVFRFPSNKLDYVLKALAIGAKVRHKGFDLWVETMAGNKEAWVQMEKYNKGDVTELEKLYKRLLPWIPGHPSHAAFGNIEACPHCGSEEFQRRGFAVTQQFKYPRYQCKHCGTWFRGNKTESDRKVPRVTGLA